MLTPHAADVSERWHDGGVEVVSFRYAPEPWELLGYGRSLDADERLRRGAMLVAPLYLLGARVALRDLLGRRSFDLLHAHWVVPNALVAAPSAARVPLAVGLHGSDVFLAERGGVRLLVRRALERTRLLTGCSAELVERICALGFDRAHSRVIPYGVDCELFHPADGRAVSWRRRLGARAEDVVALAVGRMVTKKGFHLLLDAMPDLLEAVPELMLVIAGGGDRLEEFRRRASPWPDRIRFPGPVLRDTLPDLYRAADLFVLPAVHDPRGNVDGLPNVILEAMASGLPIVASDISGIPLAVNDGREGLLVEEGDVLGLRSAVERLARDPGLRRHMGRAARDRASSELTWAAVARSYQQAYRSALRR